jgi:hypothetical protein
MPKRENHLPAIARNLATAFLICLITLFILLFGRAIGSDKAAPSPVLSVREFELRSGVKPEEFETYVRQELTHALSESKTGAHFRVLKGDRGDRKGGYILIWEFESIAARNEFFPREGGGASPACQQQWKRIKLAMEKFSIYAKEKHSYTDYVTVAD